MKPKELVAVSETRLNFIVKLIQDLENEFHLNNPTRLALSDARAKVYGAVKVNRLVKTEPQTKFIYVVESEDPL